METNEFGGTGIWFLALLFLFSGNRWGDNGSRVATQDDINFSRLENQVRSNADLTERKTDGITNGLSSLGYEVAQQFGNTNTSMAKGFCDTSKEILDSRYQTAKSITDATAGISAQIGALSSKIDQNKIESLQAQVSELKTQNMFCGIPRINPYGYGVYPYANNGCGCACNNGNI